MRLINARTFELENHDDIENRPAYAILSHRWTHGSEVTHQDMLHPHRQWMPGWSKIVFCCSQAAIDGLEYAWVDTCCIDKTSSSELSEAINSMFQWYAEAEICYAYLNDVDIQQISAVDESKAHAEVHPEFLTSIAKTVVQSLWFQRAWTLQELIAPAIVRFYDVNFKLVLTKHEMADEIAYAHRIPASVTRDPTMLSEFSAAAKMSWAASRKATRIEDRAYSLFGIFDVKLPLLYGEGMQAFGRLQEEIIRQSYDHSLFIWQSTQDGPQTALAISPDQFLASKEIESLAITEEDQPYTMTNIGLSIELQILPYTLDVFLGLLKCRLTPAGAESGTESGTGSNNGRLGILLSRSKSNNSLWYRVAVNGSSIISLPKEMTPRQIKSRSRKSKLFIMKDPTKGRILSAEERFRSSSRLFHGLKLRAPQFIEYSSDFGRGYSLRAYHDWEETRTRTTKLSNAINNFRNRTSGTPVEQQPEPSTQEISLSSLSASLPSVNLYKAPVGILRLPEFVSGTAAKIHFDKIVHGIVAIKVGYTFDFQPVLMLATHDVLENKTRSGFAMSKDSARFLKFFTFEPDSSDYDWTGGKQVELWGPSEIWGMKDSALVSSEENIDDDGSLRTIPGVHAFKSDGRLDHDHWIFKPYQDQPWHLLIEMQKQFADDLVFWEVSLVVQQETFTIKLEDFDAQ